MLVLERQRGTKGKCHVPKNKKYHRSIEEQQQVQEEIQTEHQRENINRKYFKSVKKKKKINKYNQMDHATKTDLIDTLFKQRCRQVEGPGGSRVPEATQVESVDKDDALAPGPHVQPGVLRLP